MVSPYEEVTMSRLFQAMVLFSLLSFVFGGCSDSDSSSNEPATIPASAEIVTLQGGQGEGPVIFTHSQHANEYYNGVCLTCHDHEDVAGTTHWLCRDCHTAGQDAENLCTPFDFDHGCLMTQCQFCHELEGPPAPQGTSCGVAAGDGCHFP